MAGGGGSAGAAAGEGAVVGLPSQEHGGWNEGSGNCVSLGPLAAVSPQLPLPLPSPPLYTCHTPRPMLEVQRARQCQPRLGGPKKGGTRLRVPHNHHILLKMRDAPQWQRPHGAGLPPKRRVWDFKQRQVQLVGYRFHGSAVPLG